ncbi:MAG: site-specific integrase, partial [Bacteroidetes bacterium]|nr:site-specific integrase [Bacteroidota bacterium]
TRKLTPKEIRKLWHGLPDTDMHSLIQLALKFSLVTGQRKGECINAKIADFDFTGDHPVWTISAALSKNKRPNLVPLSDLAVTLFKEARAVAGDATEWLFPSTLNNGRPMTTRAINTALVRNLETLGLEDVRPHDMRRAASTGMASVGVLREIREHVLNHSMGKLDQAYDQHDYGAEKRDALERWADKLTVILNADEKVVELETKTA